MSIVIGEHNSIIGCSLIIGSFLILLCGIEACEKDEMQHERVITEATRSSVNLIDEKTLLIDKVLDDKGVPVDDINNENVVTGYLSVYIGPYWYQKVIFLHACCEFGGAFDFYYGKVVFFDKNKQFIQGPVANHREAIKIPENARFARIQYPKGCTKYYASISNRSILNEYSPYDKRNLLPVSEKVFETIENSDGAISLLLRTGYDYLGRFGGDLGYGCYHTLFNTDCIRVLGYDNLYQGVKMQMDCSSFVQAALLGITYANSRYVLGSDSDNVPAPNAFQFDSSTEYNHYTLAFGKDCSANTGRLYANKIAKYFYDRGLLYIIEPDFANVRTGDLLFWGDGNLNADFFMNIGHVAICSDSWPEITGGRGIRIIEALSDTDIHDAENLRFGARVPLPFADIQETELLINKTKIFLHVDLNKGKQQLVTQLETKEDLLNREIYTLLLNCDLPEGVVLLCKVNKGETIVGGRSEFECYLPGSLVEKHFGFYNNEMKSDKRNLYIYALATKDINGVIEINEASLMRGYHSQHN